MEKRTQMVWSSAFRRLQLNMSRVTCHMFGFLHSTFCLLLLPPPLHQSTNPVIHQSNPLRFTFHASRFTFTLFVTACHGFVTALSRLENDKRPVFIGLGRRYGSRGVNTPPHPLPDRSPIAEAAGKPSGPTPTIQRPKPV